MSAQLLRAHQPSFAHDDWQRASAQEMCATRPNYFGYFGTFTIDAAAATVTHHLDAGWFPNLAEPSRYVGIASLAVNWCSTPIPHGDRYATSGGSSRRLRHDTRQHRQNDRRPGPT